MSVFYVVTETYRVLFPRVAVFVPAYWEHRNTILSNGLIVALCWLAALEPIEVNCLAQGYTVIAQHHL